VQLSTRKTLDRSFTGMGIFSILLMAAALLVLLVPIVVRGMGAFVFRATVEHRRFILEHFGRGDRPEVEAELAEIRRARQPVYDALAAFKKQLVLMSQKDLLALPIARRDEYKWADSAKIAKALRSNLEQTEQYVKQLLGPLPGEPAPVMPRDRYGETRWDRSLVTLDRILYRETYDYSDPTKMGVLVRVPRAELFEGTELAPLFPYAENHLAELMHPRWTFYWRFVTDVPVDASMFGGIWPMLLGTIYLTIGAMVFAVPMGVVTAIYLVEYAPSRSRLVSVLRVFISTLAGVPSIVFGLFGLAFFIYKLHVSDSPSVLAGSLTLAVLVLPTVIRASEEALRAVPLAYKEAALSLGASKWRTVVTVILPAALPGVLTGIIISMGRAAGETAPIIFTAAVSIGRPLKLWEVFSEPTPALPWNIYNLCSEHQAIEEIRHVQYGMVLVLVALVLLLNVTAILLRARISRKLRG